MSQIRRQSIISTIFVYFGFAIGFINTWLFTRDGSSFSLAEYGLTGAFIAIGNIAQAISILTPGCFDKLIVDPVKAAKEKDLACV